MSEELGERSFGAGGPWVVVLDPIDGSLNAKRCLPFYCISIAFADGPTIADVRFGYVRDFGSGEEWVREAGEGATVNGRPLGGVRPKDRLGIVDFEATNAGLVATAAARLDGHVGRIRVLGALALALCQLADGRVDGVASLKPSRSVDLAAAALIVREAGADVLLVDDPALPLDLDARSRAVAARDQAMARGWPAWCTRTIRPDLDCGAWSPNLPSARRWSPSSTPRSDAAWSSSTWCGGSTSTGANVDVTIALTVAGCPMKADLERRCAGTSARSPASQSVGVRFDVMTPEQRTALRSGCRAAPGGGQQQKAVTISARTRGGRGRVGQGRGRQVDAHGEPGGVARGRRRRGGRRRRRHLRLLDPAHARHLAPAGGRRQHDRAAGEPRHQDHVDRLLHRADAAVVWRGPMLHRALEQFLTDVHWGELDYLIVDMPPGTGDVSISLGQLLPSPDVVLVTTPQTAAQQVAERSAEVAGKTGMHVAGVIENMSYLVCPCCGERTHPFGEGGGRALADAPGRAAARRGARWTSRCASPPTPACRSCSTSPTRRRRVRSPRSPRPCRARCARAAAPSASTGA